MTQATTAMQSEEPVQPEEVRAGRATELYEAGFTNIVSVIPPGATISPNSRVDPSQRGKCPGIKSGDGDWYGYDFTKKGVRPEHIDSSGANLGVMGDRFPALDIDSENEQITNVVVARAFEELGDGLLRYSRGHRRLIMYRTDSPFRKMALEIWYKDEKHVIEFLGEKRQYLVAGTHPSGNEYRWEGKAPWDIDPDDLPEITEEGARAFLTRLRDDFRVKGIEADFQGAKAKINEPAPPQEELQAPNLEQLEAVVTDIPNDESFADREDYIAFGHAVKAAGGDEALYIFQEWCDRWEDGVNDPETVGADWGRMHPPFRIGYDYLLRLAGPQREKWRTEAAGRCFTLDRPRLDLDPSTAPTDSTLRSIFELISQLGSWEQVPRALRVIHATMADLGYGDRIIAEAAVVEQLKKRVGIRDAHRILRAFAPRPDRSPFLPTADGRTTIRPLVAEDLSIDVRFLVDDLIPDAAVGALISGYSMGKTWLAVDLALSIAFGRRWLEKPAHTGPVIFLIAEGHRAFPMRIYGWLVEHEYLKDGATVEEMFELLEGRVVINRYPTRFDDPEFEEALTATIEDTGAQLVVVDTLGKTLGPNQPENDNDIANEITGMLSGIAAITRCGVLITHHVGVANSDRARGASGWEQGLDYAYVIKGSRSDFDSGKPVTLRCTKMRDAPKTKPIPYRLKKLPGLEIRGSLHEEPVMVKSGVIERAHGMGSLASLATRVFEYVQRHPGSSQAAICDDVYGGSTAIRSAIQDLRESGAIRNLGSGQRHEWSVVEGVRVDPSGEIVRLNEVFEIGDPSETQDDD